MRRIGRNMEVLRVTISRWAKKLGLRAYAMGPGENFDFSLLIFFFF
uniref:Uncharacterized protein n=1 Tax=Lepeophtheirus salmonis TaxID=72036 RepID=A0A0K2TAW1_LEPSM